MGGSAVAGGLSEAWYFAKIEKPYVVRMAIGASGAISGIATVLSCVNPEALVSIPLVPIPVQAWVESAGMAIYSLLALKYGWSPEIGHLGHFGGMAFGAFWWLVALREIPVMHTRSFYEPGCMEKR